MSNKLFYKKKQFFQKIQLFERVHLRYPIDIIILLLKNSVTLELDYLKFKLLESLKVQAY